METPRSALTARFTLTTMLKSAAFAFLLILAGCHKNGASVAKPHGSSLPDLVTAEGAPLFAAEPPYTEVVRTGDVWKVYDRGELLGEQRIDDEAIEVFRQARERARSRDGEGEILLAAGGTETFGEIRAGIRAAAKAGFWRIEFLVRSPTDTEIRSLRLDLPTMNEPSPRWGGEGPFFQIRSDGSIHVGSGAHLVTLEGGSGTTRLDAYLKSFMESAGVYPGNPPVQIYAALGAPFQRVIDVLAELHSHGISKVHFIDPEESVRAPDGRPKPRSPGESR
jgi:biopolymer transport protein ExbD